MSRWQPDPRGRLERAAFELFLERGFAATTVPQIAARAGLTNRTFFRHFGDKREVLFAVDDEFPARVQSIVQSAPDTQDAWQILKHAFGMISSMVFQDRHEHFAARRKIIEADESLRERELAKQTDLLLAVEHGFSSLGFEDLDAAATAHTCVSILAIARQRWLNSDGSQGFDHHIQQATSAMRRLQTKTAAATEVARSD